METCFERVTNAHRNTLENIQGVQTALRVQIPNYDPARVQM